MEPADRIRPHHLVEKLACRLDVEPEVATELGVVRRPAGVHELAHDALEHAVTEQWSCHRRLLGPQRLPEPIVSAGSRSLAERRASGPDATAPLRTYHGPGMGRVLRSEYRRRPCPARMTRSIGTTSS